MELRGDIITITTPEFETASKVLNEALDKPS